MLSITFNEPERCCEPDSFSEPVMVASVVRTLWMESSLELERWKYILPSVVFIPNSPNSKDDVCGVCAGDGSSFLDCSGTEDGNSYFNNCNEIGIPYLIVSYPDKDIYILKPDEQKSNIIR